MADPKNKLKRVGEEYNKFANEPLLPEDLDLSQFQFLQPQVKPQTPIIPETIGENQGYQQRMQDIRDKGVQQEQAGQDLYRDSKAHGAQSQQDALDAQSIMQLGQVDDIDEAEKQKRFKLLQQMMENK
jgi:hypothetical protein